MTETTPDMPVEAILPALKAALEEHRNAILVAEPGAGKTTRVPTAFMASQSMQGQKIVVLEPRRIAARTAARYMARLLGEKIGETIGYSVRFDARVSARTRVELVTEGVMARRLAADPMLQDVGLLIFDEFHERSLEADMSLALALDVQEALRPDLRILIMSATLDAERLARMLGDAPVIRSRGQLYPVETRYLSRATRDSVAEQVASAVTAAAARHSGSILAFLPGEAEIRKTHSKLLSAALPDEVDILPLYAALDAATQDLAIAPAKPGRRKVVLATTIAETSLTIEGISVVIDGGFKRVARFDPGSAMTRLETVRVSASAAEQRRGRAGRLGPGICYRLWPEAENLALLAQDTPEILQADLASFMLDLALWGISEPKKLKLLDPPPAGAVAQAKDLLHLLGATDEKDLITPHGRKMAQLPLHPRLAHMVINGKERGEGWLAADIAAILQERDTRKGESTTSLHDRLALLNARDPRLSSVKRAADQIRRLADIKEDARKGDAGGLLAEAYGDRIAQARDRRGVFRMAHGGEAVIAETDPLAREQFLAVATTDGNTSRARIFLAAPLTIETIERSFSGRIITRESVHWDKRAQAVNARLERALGALLLDSRVLTNPDPERIVEAMIEGIGMLGLASLPWSKESLSLRHRVTTMRRIEPHGNWPDLSDERLAATVDSWLKPFLYGKTRRQQLATIEMTQVLRSIIPPSMLRRLDVLLPERIQVPSGSNIAVDYDTENNPILRVKLQELFGARSVKALADGKLPVKIELLSPAGRPVAVTQDLASFWANAYPQVRSELRGRYPKHHWPEDPLAAPASRGARPRSLRP